MDLVESYGKVKPAIVAFMAKYMRAPAPGVPLPPIPPIIGTGFVVREDGLVATNDHVVKAFSAIPFPPGTPPTDFGVLAVLFHIHPQGLLRIPFEVDSVARVDRFNPGASYYGPPKPDLAFVQLRGRGLPTVEIDGQDVYPEGTELATAGFPMGTDALMAPGWLHQVCPTLQRGIVSAVLPYCCPTPHAFTLNVMVQGGASGSPVFIPDTARVAGVLYASLNDIAIADGRKYVLPTNISYVLPSHYIRKSLVAVDRDGAVKCPADAPSMSDVIEKSKKVNALTGGPVNIPVDREGPPSAERVTSPSRLSTPPPPPPPAPEAGR